MLLGELVSGTECLEYTHLFLRNESITRTEGDVNYKEYQIKPSVSSGVMNTAQSMAKSCELKIMRPTSLREQYMINNDKNSDSEKERINMINKSNKNTFSDWDERQYYNKKIIMISPVEAERKHHCLTVFKCTCQLYLDQYECVHIIAMSIAKNVLPKSLSMHIPIGLRRGAGRPFKAVKGALNKQSSTKVDRCLVIDDNPSYQLNKLLHKSASKGNSINTLCYKCTKQTEMSNATYIYSVGNNTYADGSIRDTSSLGGFQWKDNSCAYDALVTSLWIAYSTGSDQLKVAFNDSLPFMVQNLKQMINHTMSDVEANNRNREQYFRGNDDRFKKGSHAALNDILIHLLQQYLSSMALEDVSRVFDFKILCHNKCPSDFCELKSNQITNRSLYFGSDIDTSNSMTTMIEQLLGLNQSSYICHDCNMMMMTTNEVVEYPLIACISFSGDTVLCNFEKRMHIRAVQYDLFCVIYHIPHHYKCRFNIANIAYEYDGMI